jgi:hypothetical protein
VVVPADGERVSRPQFVFAVVVLVASLVVSHASFASNSTVAATSRARTHGQAERDILRALNGGWGRRRIRALENSRTHLLRNNTQAVCGRIRASRGGQRFLCVVRPARHRLHQGLYIRYRALPHGRFMLRWLRYRAR